jgi:hypothetical protein
MIVHLFRVALVIRRVAAIAGRIAIVIAVVVGRRVVRFLRVGTLFGLWLGLERQSNNQPVNEKLSESERARERERETYSLDSLDLLVVGELLLAVALTILLSEVVEGLLLGGRQTTPLFGNLLGNVTDGGLLTKLVLDGGADLLLEVKVRRRGLLGCIGVALGSFSALLGRSVVFVGALFGMLGLVLEALLLVLDTELGSGGRVHQTLLFGSALPQLTEFAVGFGKVGVGVLCHDARALVLAEQHVRRRWRLGRIGVLSLSLLAGHSGTAFGLFGSHVREREKQWICC